MSYPVTRTIANELLRSESVYNIYASQSGEQMLGRMEQLTKVSRNKISSIPYRKSVRHRAIHKGYYFKGNTFASETIIIGLLHFGLKRCFIRNAYANSLDARHA